MNLKRKAIFNRPHHIEDLLFIMGAEIHFSVVTVGCF